MDADELRAVLRAFDVVVRAASDNIDRIRNALR